MAKYRPRPSIPAPIPASTSTTPPGTQVQSRNKESVKETFETSSTSPAGSTLQEVPTPHSSVERDGVRRAVTLPAMTPLVESNTSSGKVEVKPEDREMEVQGVVIPAKPRPPHEEGKPLSHHFRTLPDPGVQLRIMMMVKRD